MEAALVKMEIDAYDYSGSTNSIAFGIVATAKAAGVSAITYVFYREVIDPGYDSMKKKLEQYLEDVRLENRQALDGENAVKTYCLYGKFGPCMTNDLP